MPGNENYKQFLARNTKIKSQIFCLLGEEESIKLDFISEISKRYFGCEAEIRNFHSENSDDFSAFILFSRTSSMFSGAKSAVFSGIEKCIQSSVNRQALEELIENISSDTLLFFKISSGTVPASLKKLKTESVMFWKPFENELREQIRTAFTARKISISSQDISLIINYTGRDTGKISAAIERLHSFAGEGTVTSEMINYILTDDKEISIFEFINSLFLKNHSSFSALQKLSDNGTHELVILEFIRRELVKLEKYHIILASCGNISEALKAAGVHPKGGERFIKSVSMFNSDKISELYRHIYLTEFQLKSGNIGKQMKNPMMDLIFHIIKN